jgi:hypothetical protein
VKDKIEHLNELKRQLQYNKTKIRLFSKSYDSNKVPNDLKLEKEFLETCIKDLNREIDDRIISSYVNSDGELIEIIRTSTGGITSRFG